MRTAILASLLLVAACGDDERGAPDRNVPTCCSDLDVEFEPDARLQLPPDAYMMGPDAQASVPDASVVLDAAVPDAPCEDWHQNDDGTGHDANLGNPGHRCE